MGFSVVKDHLRAEAATKLQLQHQPPSPLLVSRLVANPPQNQAEAQMMFEYLASRISSVSRFVIYALYDSDLFCQVSPQRTYGNLKKCPLFLSFQLIIRQ